MICDFQVVRPCLPIGTRDINMSAVYICIISVDMYLLNTDDDLLRQGSYEMRMRVLGISKKPSAVAIGQIVICRALN